MDSKSLMIGDWVNRHTYTGKPHYCRIILLGHSEKLDCEPIPLTEEILAKNGFERGLNISDTEPFDLDEEGNAYYQVGELGYLNPHLWGWYKDGALELPNMCTMYIKIHYVHELQHALRLCGLNDLADSFKV